MVIDQVLMHCFDDFSGDEEWKNWACLMGLHQTSISRKKKSLNFLVGNGQQGLIIVQ